MALPKPALLRAVSDEIPVAMLDQLGSTYISEAEIFEIARGAVTGGRDDSTTFAGINRYIFIGAGNNAFIDPAGTLVQDTREYIRELRRSQAADPAGLKAKDVRPVSRQQPAQPLQPSGGA